MTHLKVEDLGAVLEAHVFYPVSTRYMVKYFGDMSVVRRKDNHKL
jgi:hypothetical protein